MTYLVDSTAYIDWMRSGRNPVRILGPWIRAGALVGCGIIRAEVLRGICSETARQEMEALFAYIPDVPLTPERWNEVAELAWELDRAGHVLPLTDVTIAVCAQSVHATIITRDKHFHSIPGLKMLADLPGHM